MLTGKLADYAEQTDPVGGRPAYVITATLVTDHPAYGGHHRVLFADRLALELRAFREVSQATPLEVTVDGWLRSQRGQAVVVADRVMYHVERRDAPGGGAASRIGCWRWLANAVSGACN